MNKPDDFQKLNPQIAKVQIGIRNLREIDIFPLSIADWIKLCGLIAEVSKDFVSTIATRSEAELIVFVINVLKEHLGEILAMVTNVEQDVKLDEISAVQASYIAHIVYVVNVEEPAKNLKGLPIPEKMKEQMEKRSKK